MPFTRLILASAALLALSGCVPPPAPGSILPATGQVVLSQNCAAGFYQCVLPSAGPVGTPCACPGLGAPSYGTIR